MGPGPARFDVVICSAPQDRPAVRLLLASLQAAGLAVWFEEEQVLPGHNLVTVMQEGLTRSDRALVCLSPHFAASPWAHVQWQTLFHRQFTQGGHLVVPVLVGECPEADIPELLRPIARGDLRTPQGLASVIAVLGEKPAPSPRPPAPPPTEYRLTLRRPKGLDGLEATWTTPEGIGEAFPLRPPLDDKLAGEIRWYLEDYLRFPGAGDQAHAAGIEDRLVQLGSALYDALRPPGVREDPLTELMAQPHPQLTLISDDADALSQPFELLRDNRGPLLFRGLVLRRQLPGAKKTAPRLPGLPLRVLLITARPTDVSFIDPRASARPILDALDHLGGLAQVELCEPPTLAELTRRLDQAQREGLCYHLVHFDGHGVYLREQGVGALCFEDARGKSDLVPGTTLGDLLTRMDIPLVVLEACQTADLSHKPVFGSVAPALLRSGVGSVIAFSHAVLVSAARILVEHFYQGLCQGDTVGRALGAARRQLYANPERGSTRRGHKLKLKDWHIAQLYQTGADPVLVPGGVASRAGKTESLHRGKAPEGSFVPAPMYGFHGRARELQALRRKLQAHRAVLVTGMGGMGKTSLAREAAHWWHRTGLRPGGAAFFSFERRQGADRAIEAFGAYLEGPDFTRLPPEERWARAVALFRDTEVLWVWDNFESTLPQYQDARDPAGGFPAEERDRLAKLFRELTAAGARGWLVVTCRPEETGLGGIAEMALSGLSAAEALEMAHMICEKGEVDLERPGYEREAVEALLQVLGCHPLSLELVVRHLKKLTPAQVQGDMRRLLEQFTRKDAEEARNRGLRASLAFSTECLSSEAREMLPWLAWFQGGVFEDVVIDFSECGAERWDCVRGELLGTALVRAEDEVSYGGRSYLHFHPTLPFAADPDTVPERDAAARRFVAVYLEMAAAVDRVFRGAQPAAAMKVMSREEENLRRATALAFELGDFERGAGIAETVSSYLTSAGRVRDRERWAAATQKSMAGAARGPAAWAAERDHAGGLATSGRAGEAVEMLERQLREVDTWAGEGAELQRALCLSYMGRILNRAGQPRLAVDPLQRAIKSFEGLTGQETNLSAALGDLSNALRRLGRHDEALTVAERALALARKNGDARSEAAGLGMIASILAEQQRFADAEERYREAITAARRAGDPGLEGTCLQHMGSLLDDQGQYAQAVTQYQVALERFQAADNRPGEMQTCDLLGSAEKSLDHYDAARAWYAKAEAMAADLKDERQLATTAQNIGILLQSQAMALPAGPESQGERRRLLLEACAAVTRSLEIDRRLGNEVDMAASSYQLGALALDLGDLDRAEHHLRDGLGIGERLGLPDVWKDYGNLEKVATARGDAAQAAEWRAKKEAQFAKVERLRRGDGPPRLPPGLLDALQNLCQGVYQCRIAGKPAPPDLAEVLTQLTAAAEPLATVGRFLQTLAAGSALPAVPTGLPDPLPELLQALLDALK